MGFEGFSDGGRFFERLAKHQSRDWFAAHKAEFVELVEAPMKALLAEQHERADRAYAHVDLDAPKVFRIARDTRFSADKSPYKTHIGGFLPTRREGKATEAPIALYVHVGLPRSFAAAGHYMMDPAALARFRAAVADERGESLVKLLASLQRRGFTVESRETLKRAPRGFDPGHPRAGLLMRKGLTVGFPAIPPEALRSRALSPWLARHVAAAAPLVEWLVFATA